MAKTTFDSVVASRKLSLAFVALLCLSTSVQAEASSTLWVSRRISNDLYQLNSGAHTNCGFRVRTYLINEKQCALDEDLLSGKAIFL